MSSLKQIEDKWRNRWENAHVFEADPDQKKQKVSVAFPYPYMNGPLHAGHAFTAARVDKHTPSNITNTLRKPPELSWLEVFCFQLSAG
jgi:isoleucyl-tRNA synthetase